jgi:DNA polymerase-3 subunit epsilon
MREIALDTETTGFDPFTGDKIIEIGCVELINKIPTNNVYHVYINPERSVPEESIKIHGLRDEFLKDKPIFSQIVNDFLEFIKDSPLVIHNAEFDLKFLNCELKNIGFYELKNEIIDTIVIAREKFPGSPANLDALCRRFNIDNSNRKIHGALLDAQLLSEVYLELYGGRQHELLKESLNNNNKENFKNIILKRDFKEDRKFDISEEEKEKHKIMLQKIKDSIWY